MRLKKEQLGLKEGISREWLITNGIGGYASSTALGINTRKYHGLLVAPLTPPARRHVILSKIDESVEIENKKYDLYSNICKNYISEGYKYQEEFEKEYVPIFTYKVEDVTVKKLICMEYGKNTVCILYKIKNDLKKNVKLTITPILNFRDFHSMNTNHEFILRQKSKDNKVKIEIDEYTNNPIYMYSSSGTYIEHFNDSFRNMYYIEEEKRGFFPEENHVIAGRYEIDVEQEAEKEISFICSLEENIEEINAKTVINKEVIRINELMYEAKMIEEKYDISKATKEEKKENEILRYFCLAIDNFIVYRPSFGYHTIIAGYPWFLDWGRDSLISFEGLLLCTNRNKTQDG